MTATTCCTPKSLVYQIQVRTTRSSISSILSRTSSPTSIYSLTDAQPKKLIKKDVNNNSEDHHRCPPQQQQQQQQQQSMITNSSNDRTVNDINEEEFLSYVGLRHKSKNKSPPVVVHQPLAKRLAAPICLLPLPKYSDRVRQALYILLPFLKFLTINTNMDEFCLPYDQITSTNLQLRTVKPTLNKPDKRKVSKGEFVQMAATTLRNNSRKTPMAKYIYSTIQCEVIVDRLDKNAIDQIMNDCSDVKPISNSKSKSLSSSTTACLPQNNHNNNNNKRMKISADLTDKYQRIYLKCFVCSKREYIDSETTNSDILHSHWLKHGNDVLLNIYDSEIEQILTRVVEFFSFPRRHPLEGNIQTVFILNSKEIQRTSTKPLDDSDCIVID